MKRTLAMKILAIDFNSLMNRSFYAIRHLSNREGFETNALFGFTKIYLKLLAANSPDVVVAAYDLRAPTFRHKLYDAYKGTRSPMPEELRPQMPVGREFVDLAGGTVIGVEGYEADDILGTVARYADEHPGTACVIATGDRDSLQLVSGAVTVSLATNKGDVLYTPETVREQYGLEPRQLIEVKSLMGDTSDNIPGVKGIGEKTALSLIQQNHDLQNILDHLEDIPATPRIKKLIAEHREDALLSRKLGEIDRNVPMDFDPEQLAQKKPREPELEALLRKYELTSVLGSFGFPKEEQLTLEASPAPSAAVAENPGAEELFAALREYGRVPFLLETEGRALKTLRVCTGRDSGAVCTENLEALFAGLLALDLPRITFDAKPVYHAAMERGIDPGILEDVKLQAYLLSNSDKTYSIPELIHAYLPAAPDFPPEFQETAAVPLLFDAMTAILKERDMTFVYEEIERPLCPVLASMEREGVLIDRQGVSDFGNLLSASIEELKTQLVELAGQPFNPNSPAHLSGILFNKLGLPKGKKTKTGYSTDVDVLEKLIPYHPIAGKILEYRQLSKLYNTYVIGLQKCVRADGRIHSTFNQTETRTGRISSSDPNVQNIPVRTALGAEMRKFFVAKEGCTLVDADYSQIELRVLAARVRGRPHDRSLPPGRGHPPDDRLPGVPRAPLRRCRRELRSRSKAINFGIVYGISAYSLSQDIGVTVRRGPAVHRRLSENLLRRGGLHERLRGKGEERTAMWRPSSTGRRFLPDIHSKKPALRGFSERVAMNMPIQGTAADIIKLAMIRVSRRLTAEGMDSRLILQVHDELIVEAPLAEADRAAEIVREEMEHAVSLAVEMKADVHQGRTWYAAKG